MDLNKDLQLQLLPQERVQNVKPCWETIPDEQRVELLSVDLNELKLRADDLAEKAKKQAGRGPSLPQTVASLPLQASRHFVGLSVGKLAVAAAGPVHAVVSVHWLLHGCSCIRGCIRTLSLLARVTSHVRQAMIACHVQVLCMQMFCLS